MKIDTQLRDLLIERGATADDIKYLEQSESVTVLLSWADYRDSDGSCYACTGGSVHDRECGVFDALHALGKTDDLIDRAHDYALNEHRRRYNYTPNRYMPRGHVNIMSDPNVPEGRIYAFMESALYGMNRATIEQMPRLRGLEAWVPEEGTFFQFPSGEQPTLNDTPAVDDGDGLDVDDA